MGGDDCPEPWLIEYPERVLTPYFVHVNHGDPDVGQPSHRRVNCSLAVRSTDRDSYVAFQLRVCEVWGKSGPASTRNSELQSRKRRSTEKLCPAGAVVN